MAYNPYINSFNTSGDFETYIESSTPKAPNVAYLKDLDQVRYTTMLPNDYVVFGTTTGTTDFTSCGITFKVAQATDGGDNILYVESSGVPQSLTSLNSCFNNTEGKRVNKIKKWAINTSGVTNMYQMFFFCTSLNYIDVSSFDTSSATDMARMFYNTNVTSLDVSNFNTSNVTSMYSMFGGCSNLTSLDVSNFNTSNVTSMNSMFQDTKVTSLDVSNFNTSNVTDMGQMFSYCTNLTSLDLSSFDTNKVTYMQGMLNNCTAITKFYISSSFFNSYQISNYDVFNQLSSWTDADSIEQFVQAAEAVNGSGKSISLSTQTKNVLTQAQKDRITGAGWTIG